MKTEINDNELELVVGGTVVVSDLGKVGFTTMGKKFKLQGVGWRTARNYAEELHDQHSNMSNSEFDQFVYNEFVAKGWINP